MNGPGATVAGGMVFVNSGYGSIGFMAGNAILAFTVDRQIRSAVGSGQAT